MFNYRHKVNDIWEITDKTTMIKQKKMVKFYSVTQSPDKPGT
jgi:ABC-type uncharacterized transport system ATPase subunit